MNARIQENQLKGLFFTILFIVLILQTIIADAQSGSKNPYKQFTVTFETRSSGTTSDIPYEQVHCQHVTTINPQQCKPK